MTSHDPTQTPGGSPAEMLARKLDKAGWLSAADDIRDGVPVATVRRRLERLQLEEGGETGGYAPALEILADHEPTSWPAGSLGARLDAELELGRERALADPDYGVHPDD